MYSRNIKQILPNHKIRYFILISMIILSSLEAREIKFFDIHFAVITKNSNITIEQLKNEVNILNKYFVNENRKKIVQFRFKSASLCNDIKDSKCSFVKLGDTTLNYNSDDWASVFNACADAKVRDKKAINFYIYDSYSKNRGFKDITGHGKRNSNRPYILIDKDRINHTIQSPEEHEMGHAFGLGHTCEPNAKRNSNTNIMASSARCNGSGGLRNIGFNKQQVNTILKYSKKIMQRFR